MIMTYNIRSFHKHKDEFHSMMRTPKSYPHILILAETWFSPDYFDTLASFTAFHSFRSTRKSSGVSVLIRNTFPSRLLSNLSFVDNDIEVCTVEVAIKHLKLIVIGVYRPNDGNLDKFMAHLRNIFQSTSNRQTRYLVLGDLNINLLSESSSVTNFIDFMSSYYFLEYMTVPTRFEDNCVPS